MCHRKYYWCGRYDNRGSANFSPISHVTDAFLGLDPSLPTCQILMFDSFYLPPLIPLCLLSGAVEICVALSVCNLPVLVPALAARRERDTETFEGTRTGFSFGRQQTTFLSTLNTVQMHIEPGQGYEEPEPLKSRGHQDSVECNCSVPLSKRGEYCSACFPRKEHPL